MQPDRTAHTDILSEPFHFPFPFKSDSYRYSNNSEKLDPPFLLTITPSYREEIQLKRRILQEKHTQAYQSFSHSLEAQWEIAALVLQQMAERYPAYFQLTKNGEVWIFQNHLLAEKDSFIFGDASTLPYEPLDFVGRHIQEDLIYIAQRDGDLYMDAGQLCFPANWSIAFNLGMTYMEFHKPVPGFSESGLAEKVRNFIMRLEAGNPFGRLNWTMTVEHVLDTFPETFDNWGAKKNQLTLENAGQLVHLRVEDQRLFRMPQSNGILFSIHTHLIELDEIIKNPEWVIRFYHVLKDLPDYIAQYKGFSSYKTLLLEYLREKSNTEGRALPL